MYQARIKIPEDIIKVLRAEDNWNKSRSSLVFKGKQIIIHAKDVIAFKATINGLLKLIEAYEQAFSITKDGKRQRD